MSYRKPKSFLNVPHNILKHLLFQVWTAVLGLILPCSACTGGNPGKELRILIRPVFNSSPLELGMQKYKTIPGDSVCIASFKFYLSHLELLRQAEVVAHAKLSCHLFDADDSTTAYITFDCPPNTSFTGIRFLFGVDSITNVSGALDGDLDPARGMYWAWNTGYINARLTGSSPACATLHHGFEFHLGGYLAPYRSAQEVTLSIGLQHPDDQSDWVLQADVAKALQNIHLHDTKLVVTPGVEAVRMSENLSRMFSLEATKHLK